VRAASDVGPWPCLLVRTDGNADALVSSLRQLARRVDPAVPVLRVATLRDHLDGLHHYLRVASWLPEWCGLASLALAAMGAHGLLAYRVARQWKEIGLRMALGADRHAVIQLVVARTLQAVLIGLAAGGVGSFVLSRVFGSLFSGAATLDVWTLALSALTLTGVAVLASVAPCWHAVRIDPATTLRRD
jgi:hypothetical protein